MNNPHEYDIIMKDNNRSNGYILKQCGSVYRVVYMKKNSAIVREVTIDDFIKWEEFNGKH